MRILCLNANTTGERETTGIDPVLVAMLGKASS